jgi:hypothetical protein
MQRGRILIYVFWVIGAIYFLGSLAASIYSLGSPATSNKPAVSVGSLNLASPHVVAATLVTSPVISPDIPHDEPAFSGNSPVRVLLSFPSHDQTAGGISRSAVVQELTGFSRGE